MAISVERELLLTLLRSALVPEFSCSGLPEGIDWQKLISEADCQCVSVIASDGLQRLYDEGLYSAQDEKEVRRLKARWFGKTMKYEHRYAGQMKAAKKMGEWLASTGIQMVVLKGFTVSECYPVPGHRYSADLDCFLIKDGEHMEAYELGNKVMEEHGLKVNRGYYKNSSFDLPGLHVENHKFCTPFRGNKTLTQFERLLQGMLLDGPLTPIGDTGLLAPPPLASALFLTEHAYSHFLHEGLNLRHILDWALFRRRHASDVDWARFDAYCAEFGFTRFLSSIDAVGEYVLGTRFLDDLTPIDRRFLADVWKGPSFDHDKKGLRARIFLAGNTLRAAWKYRQYSNISMVHALWIQVKGFFFMRRPEI
ncbi:MAG: nucleotidyltransferase family protein [Bacteroidales bacterium]|nr:nucleotidyltransferase family protein [Bacteroidales bacterium]